MIHFLPTIRQDFRECHAQKSLNNADRAEKRLRKSMSCGNDCGLRRGFIQNGDLFAGK